MTVRISARSTEVLIAVVALLILMTGAHVASTKPFDPVDRFDRDSFMAGQTDGANTAQTDFNRGATATPQPQVVRFCERAAQQTGDDPERFVETTFEADDYTDGCLEGYRRRLQCNLDGLTDADALLACAGQT